MCPVMRLRVLSCNVYTNMYTETEGSIMPPKLKKKKARRAYGEGSIVTRPNGLFVGRMRLGYKPDGTPRIVQVTSMDWDALLVKMDEAKSLYREHGVILDKKTTLATWGEKWLSEIASKRLGPNTYATHASLLRKWVIPTIGDRIVSEISPADIRRVHKALETAGRSTTTALQCYRAMSSCLEDAKRENLVGWNVCEKVDPPRKAVSTRGAFSVPEVLAIINAATQHEHGTQLILQLFTALRQGEKLGLKWENVDLEAGTITVVWQLQELTYRHGCGARARDGVYECGYKQGGRCPKKEWAVPDDYEYKPLEGTLALTKPKSKAGERMIPLIEPMVLALKAHKKLTAGIPNPHDLVFHKDGHPIPERLDQDIWKDLIASVGIPRDRTTHWARHSVATLLKAAGVDTRIIGEIVGHGSTAVTEGYVHISSDQARDAMTRLGSVLTAPALPAAAAS